MNKALLDSIPKIRVVIRKRPLGKKEIAKGDKDVVESREGDTIIVREKRTKVDLTKYIEEHTFTFDNAFGHESTNEEIYEEVVRPLVAAAFGKAKVTCFAYGQTGSGKTFTMMGDLKKDVKGLYLLAANDIFTLQSNQYMDISVKLLFSLIFLIFFCGANLDFLGI